MKKLLAKMENAFAAVAFAEAGEFNTAVEFLDAQQPVAAVNREKMSAFEKTFAAVAFAEAGCPDMALEFMNQKPRNVVYKENLESFMKTVGLWGVRVNYGVARV